MSHQHKIFTFSLLKVEKVKFWFSLLVEPCWFTCPRRCVIPNSKLKYEDFKTLTRLQFLTKCDWTASHGTEIRYPSNTLSRKLLKNLSQGWIACGGDGGLLKVLKLEAPTGPDAKLKVKLVVLVFISFHLFARVLLRLPICLWINHWKDILEALCELRANTWNCWMLCWWRHLCRCATWNPLFRKLTTSDENGLIIVWMLHKGMW